MSLGLEEEKVYRCLRCGSVFSKRDQILPGSRCPICGFRIYEKVRPNVPKRLNAA